MTDKFKKALEEFNTKGDALYKEGINEGAWWAYEFLDLYVIDGLNVDNEILKSQLDKAVEALQYIAMTQSCHYGAGTESTRYKAANKVLKELGEIDE